MTLQPAVRIFLTFLVAALSTLVAMVDDQTIRLIGAPIISGLAAVGIVPPQVPTRTSIDTEDRRVNVVSEDGLAESSVAIALGAAALAIALVLLLR